MSSIAIVGQDGTMVYDEVRRVLVETLGDLDPAIALVDVTAREAGAEEALARALEALRTPGFLVARRVVVVREAQALSSEEAKALEAWMADPTPDADLVVAVVGSKAHRLVKAAGRVVEASVGTRAKDRSAFVETRLRDYGLVPDAECVEFVAERVGEEVARVDALARTLVTIFGPGPVSAAQVAPYVGDAGAVPPWDLTDAIDRGDVAGALATARRMLESRERSGLQLISLLERHYLAMVRLEGAGVRSREEAAALLSMSPFPAEKALRGAQRLGRERLAGAVSFLAQADADLKGGTDFGGRDLESDEDATEATVLEVLVARLASLSRSARRG